MAAAVARDEPHTAAKPEQAKIDEIANAPGIRLKIAFAASNKPPVNPAWNDMKPIKRNIGTAESVQLETKESGVVERIPIAGVKPNNIEIPRKGTVIKASATGTRSAKRTIRRITP
jgi:hypothetical protein